jgi:hypothetical protein
VNKIIKRIKKSWTENRVLFLLTAILICCLILILGVAIDYFLGSSKDKYGDRLDGIKDVEITSKEISSIESQVKEDEKITDCSIKQIGKVIYIEIKFSDDITLVEAEGKALGTLDLFSEKELAFYDVNYTLIQDETETNSGFTIMGSKNVNGSGLVWNNNTPVSEE